MAEYNSWHTGIEIDNAVDEVANKINSVNGNEIDKNIVINPNNLLDTNNLFANETNCTSFDGNLGLFYLADVDTYCRLMLNNPLKNGKEYILSFDCVGVADFSPKFILASYSDSQGRQHISDEFVISNGKNVVKVNPVGDVNDYISFDDTDIARSIGQEIVLSNFHLQEGNVITTYQPSFSKNNTNENFMRDSFYNDKVTWNSCMIGGKYCVASCGYNVTDDAMNKSIVPDNSVTRYQYLQLPFPMARHGATGSCGASGCFVSPVYGKYGNGGYTGLYYRIQDTKNSDTYNGYVNLSVSGRIIEPPKNPTIQYNATIAQQIVDLAQSYVDAQESGREFMYGNNIFYIGSNIVNYRGANWVGNHYYKNNDIVWYNNTSYKCVTTHTSPSSATQSYWTTYWEIVNSSAAMMECDTFVGMVLRGISYANSPFAKSDAPSYEYTYEQLMSQQEYLDEPWVNAMRTHLHNDNIDYFPNDIRTASSCAWMFWGMQGHIFSDFSQAKKGDIAFWKIPNKSNSFDGITHCAILDFDENNNPYIYEVTGIKESGGKILQRIALSQRLSKPTYFARPY